MTYPRRARIHRSEKNIDTLKFKPLWLEDIYSMIRGHYR